IQLSLKILDRYFWALSAKSTRMFCFLPLWRAYLSAPATAAPDDPPTNHPVVVEDLGQVLLGAVGQEHEDVLLFAALARVLERSGDRRARRSADEQSSCR